MNIPKLLSVTLGITLGLLAQAQAQTFLTNGLVAYYPFNGNANDQTTNANNGTPNNAVLTADKLNQAANAYAFNGANAFISAPNKAYLTFPNGGDFSISVWAAFSSVASPNFYFIGCDNGPGNNPKWILQYGQLALLPTPPAGNFVTFHMSRGLNVGYALATTPHNPALGTWHHYLVTKAGTSYTLYIDGALAIGATNYMNDHGVLKVIATGPSAMESGITAPLTIGEAESGGFVNGKLDDIRIYNRALPSSEVAQLYAIESGPRVDLIKAVKPSFYNLTLTTNYQMQVSGDMSTWTNYGSPFTAISTNMIWPQYFDVANWNSLFFRLQVSP